MKPSFSEFSYGYAVTEDIVRSQGPLSAAPSFPSLRREGVQGGFDVALNLPVSPLFLQFKLSDCMVRDTAYEAQMGLLATPFYKMHLQRGDKSRQHKLLLDLEAIGNAVYYVAPAFHLEEEFNRAYMRRSILTDSVMIPPSQIGPLTDDENHHIAFKDARAAFGYLLSRDWRRVKIHGWGQMVEELNQRQWTQAERPLQELLLKLEAQMLNIVKSHFGEEPRRESITAEDPISRVASLSQVIFNCTLFIVQRNT